LCLHCQVKASFFLGENRFASGLGKLAAANRWIKIGVTRCRAIATLSSCTGDESAHPVTATLIGTHKMAQHIGGEKLGRPIGYLPKKREISMKQTI